MRILAVAPFYEPEGGGLERYAHAILRRLAARGHVVEALAFTRGRPAVAGRDGVRVRRLRPLMRWGNAPVHPGFGADLRAALAGSRPDVIVAHTPVPFPAEMAYRAAARAGVPFVVTYHAGMLRGSSPVLDRLAALDRATFERRMLDGADRLIAVSPYVRDHALSGQAERVTVIPPGVDCDRFSPGSQARRANLLFIGPLDRSYRWKGVDILWDAFLEVKAQRPDATLTLVGAGDRHAEFAARSVHEPALLVLRHLSEPELVREYQRAAVTVLPSTSDAESFGMVLAEANACGCPVVASRIGGIPSFVRDGDNGRPARPADARDLAAKILELLEDPAGARAMGSRGRTLVRREHDWDDLARRTETVLGEASGHAPDAGSAVAVLPA